MLHGVTCWTSRNPPVAIPPLCFGIGGIFLCPVRRFPPLYFPPATTSHSHNQPIRSHSHSHSPPATTSHSPPAVLCCLLSCRLHKQKTARYTTPSDPLKRGRAIWAKTPFIPKTPCTFRPFLLHYPHAWVPRSGDHGNIWPGKLDRGVEAWSLPSREITGDLGRSLVLTPHSFPSNLTSSALVITTSRWKAICIIC